ncbi:DUF4411 family protein [Frigidibacter sp. ROC022]|uniref:DUF4411 family protein n=1 Tax=Frigidibacter sp. ROC022 TaxID=2971796 RepID=UPI00215A1F4B|nr:DUF4411 family protein [Frigidibacter sp. ROC022]MCR8725125.1 DUF4411 family protein [Frigidibacter sp. ROC022]
MYLFDTNAFLTPANTYYAFDICGGYWDWILEAATAGEVSSIDMVKRELRRKDDQIRNWIDIHASAVFQSETTSDAKKMKEIAAWAVGGKYTPEAQAEFLSKADSMLVARAMNCDGTVVTLEISEPRRQNRVKVPDACRAHGVKHITPYELLRKKGVRLIK